LAINKWYRVDVTENEIKCFVEKGSCFAGKRFITRENFIKYFTTPFNLALKQRSAFTESSVPLGQKLGENPA